LFAAQNTDGYHASAQFDKKTPKRLGLRQKEGVMMDIRRCIAISNSTMGLMALVVLTSQPLFAQAVGNDRNTVYDPVLFNAMEYRMIGPYRGGRSTAVTGTPADPYTFFMGTTGGGVWKTEDAGSTWENISDGSFDVASIGAVEVAGADPNVIYVGTGSACIRGNVSAGRGVYKSDDGGKTWEFAGLRDAGQIGRIVVHPNDPDWVYLAVLGHAFGKSDERGVYRSKDGGATWDNVLFLSDSTGAADLAMNPRNPREIYAGMWRGERKPWALISGSEEAGVYKTTDGGDTWEKVGGGLPTGMVGKVGVTVSPANPDRVWALIEAEPEGGVYRSDDAGKTWQRVNQENKLRQRAWYYTHIYADPQDANTVYALNTRFYRSVDGGRTFEQIQVEHGDMHDLWINPNDPETMIVGDDGGGQVSLTGGKSWSTMNNQPTAELYGVTVDNAFPYRAYGAQQDNTTISVQAWSSSNTLHPKQFWFSVGGCETGPIALHPDYPNIVYAGCYGGVIDRFDRETGQIRNMVLYPQLQLAEAPRNLRYRFQWVSPIEVSPHDPTVVYHASQRVHRTRDGGMTWETISPDLTTNTPEHQDYPGGPINHDGTGVEVYNVIFALEVSPHSADVIWAGTDDGRVHISQDNGQTWTEITPREMPEFGTVNRIEVSPHRPGRAFLAVQRYRFDDFAPYVFRTNDHGESWELLTNGRNGIPGDHPVRVVREDPDRQGLLYAGTEFGLFVSFNDGRNWQSLQLNLPVTPVTGMQVRHKDLILSTQGRSFWVLDDVTPLHQITDEVASARMHLYQPRDAYRVNAGGEAERNAPEPLPGNALIHYYFAQAPEEEVRLDILDDQGRLVRSFTSDSAKVQEDDATAIPTDAGTNRTTWDLMYTSPDKVEAAVIWGYSGGVKAPPGTYRVRLNVGEESQTVSFRVLKDPRLANVTQQDFVEQFNLAIAIRDTLDEVYDAIRTVDAVRGQVTSIAERADAAGYGTELKAPAESIAVKLTSVEAELMQTKNQSNQDPIRFPSMLDNQYIALYEYVTGVDGYRYGGPEGKPTEGAYLLFDELNTEWAALRRRLKETIDTDVAQFNVTLAQLGVPAITVPGVRERPIP
jgi:photosystem II stability/assembly factor-like uncharacterized protein